MKKRLLLLSILCFCLTGVSAFAQRMDRGLSMNDLPQFITKGNLMLGGTVSYRDFKSFDYKFLLLTNMNVSGYTFKVSPYISYFFRDNMAAGAKFAYERSLVKVDKASLNISPDLGLEVADIYSLGHTYSGSITYRYYIPLGKSKIFGLFSELDLDFGFGQSKLVTGKGENLTGTYQQSFDIGLGLVPGVVAFVSNDVAVEASIGIMGLKYSRVKQFTNQVIEGSYETSSANFKVNLFSINIGISFLIPVYDYSKNAKKS